MHMKGSGSLFSHVQLIKATPPPRLSFEEWAGFSLCLVRHSACVMIQSGTPWLRVVRAASTGAAINQSIYIYICYMNILFLSRGWDQTTSPSPPLISQRPTPPGSSRAIPVMFSGHLTPDLERPVA